MKTYQIPHTELTASRIAYGCMNIGGGWNDDPLTQAEVKAAVAVVRTAYEAGITLFDHADIYRRGKSETAFAEALRQMPGMRENIVLQSKCGIRFANDPVPGAPGRYDFSYAHIISAVEGSLRRLEVDYLDILLLHRPDPLVEPEEVARAFAELHGSGKVRYFGVSNFTAGQIELLQHFLDQPLVINQVELSLMHPHLISEGVLANRVQQTSTLSTGTLDYCRRRNILIQAYSPVAGGLLFDAGEDSSRRVREAAELVAAMAREKGTSREAILLAWLLRHPAPIQPIIGTTRPERVQASCLADGIELSREEWYRLLNTARGESPP
jgi:predicted oxidoreductase